METKFQTSFIPKKPINITSSHLGVRRPRSLLSIVAMIIFILTLLAVGGLFGYSKLLVKQNEGLKVLVQNELEANFNPAFVSELTNLNSRIETSEELLPKHVSLSFFLKSLGSLTVKNIQFTDFNYSGSPGGTVTVTMKGRGTSYSAIVSQYSIFTKEKSFINPSFSDFSLDDKGGVVFNFKTTLSPTAVSYKNTLQINTADTVSSSLDAPFVFLPDNIASTTNQ